MIDCDRLSVERGLQRKQRLKKLGKRTVILACSSAIAAFTPSVAEAALPPQGVFESCNVSTDLPQCIDRQRQLGQAGFRLMLNGGALKGAPAEAQEYAQMGSTNGIQQIWSLSDMGWWQDYDPDGNNMLGVYPRFAEACLDCSSNDQLLRFIVSSLRAKSTKGYYIADDSAIPKGNATPYLAGLQAFTQRIHEADPVARTIVSNYRPDDSGRQLAQYEGVADVVLQEQYQVRDNSPMLSANSPFSLNTLQSQIKYTSLAIRRGRRPSLQTGAIQQAFAWSDSLYDNALINNADPATFDTSAHPTRFPTQKQLDTMRDTTLSVGNPSMVMYFSATQFLGWPRGQSLPFWYDPALYPAVQKRRLRAITTSAFRPFRLPKNSQKISR